jgi:hypothetical protein
VIIGINSTTLEPDGLDDDQLETWTYDHLASSVNEYASPSISFDLEVKPVREKKLVVIQVHEFADIPNPLREGLPPDKRERRLPHPSAGGVLCQIPSHTRNF